jgi:glycosyltransferase involved in cell wall biosynthesis
MFMKIDFLSVFFPAFNEEKNITPTVEKASAVLERLKLKNYEIIVIDDGSTDGTAKAVRKLQEKNPHLRLIVHSINKGYGEALKSGFYNAKYPWIVYTDSDGQFDFSEITKFFDRAQQADLIIGYRVDRRDHFIRKLGGRFWTLLANILFGIKVHDVDCAFKLVRREVIEKIPRLESGRGGMISPELLAKAKKAGFRIAEVGVCHYPRKSGQSTGANLKVIVESFIDLIGLWWKIK